jgi:hypothetical protein
MKRIAIQGEIGSFHDIAAHQYFKGEQIELICCSTFEQVFENIKRDPTVIGMIAIENTIAGSLLHNYDLLLTKDVVVPNTVKNSVLSVRISNRVKPLIGYERKPTPALPAVPNTSVSVESEDMGNVTCPVATSAAKNRSPPKSEYHTK